MGCDRLHSPKLAKLLPPGKVLAFGVVDKRYFLGPKSIGVLAVAEVERPKGYVQQFCQDKGNNVLVEQSSEDNLVLACQ